MMIQADGLYIQSLAVQLLEEIPLPAAGRHSSKSCKGATVMVIIARLTDKGDNM